MENRSIKPQERRSTDRSQGPLSSSLVACCLVHNSAEIPLKIVNLHFQGACLQVEVGDERPKSVNSHLRFKLGRNELNEQVNYRIVWETIADNGQFGVEFLSHPAGLLARKERFFTHRYNQPVVIARDPLDPNRTVYFSVLNISSTGMLLSTSLTNKHIFPGMDLRASELTISGIGKVSIDLFVENSRSGADNSILYGVSVKGTTKDFQDLTSKYTSSLGTLDSQVSRLEKLSSEGMIQRDLRRHLTIREVTTAEEYDAVLKLRYTAYQKVGKVKATGGYESMGEGYGKEGLVLGAYLGAELVATVELRFSDRMQLRVSERLNIDSIPKMRGRSFVEINKLAVHPYAQKTDIVVGLFQKIHAVTMVNGKPDGLLVAEDKLVPLYERLGSEKIGVSYEHPHRPDLRLHVMILPRETYEEASGINPLAWSTIYETTHSFLADSGLADEKIYSLREKAVKKLSLLASKVARPRKRKRRDSDSTKVTKTIAPSSVIDPKWTKQHLHVSVFLPFVMVADDLIGATKVDGILSKVGFPRSYFTSSSNWVSVAFFDVFIEGFTEFGDVNELQKAAGYKGYSKEVLGVNRFLLKHFLTPSQAYKNFSGILAKFNKTRTFEIVENTRTHCRIRIGLPDKALKPKDPSAKHLWHAILDGLVLVMTGAHAEVEEVQSIFDGAAYCEYVVRWRSPLFSKHVIFLTLMTGGGLFATYRKLASTSFSLQNLLVTSNVAFVLATAVVCFVYWKLKQRYSDMVESLSTSQRDSDERYRELQSSKDILETGYQEGKFLESMSREIQISNDLNHILDISLDAICGRFGFNRAFIMLVDSEKKFLRTSAVKNAGEATDAIWSFKVDVSKRREDPLVLSSVYFSGQSLLIKDVNESMEHFNEESQRLIKNLKSVSFGMVPIPSATGNWGVLIADKGAEAENPMNRRDLVSLQRVCQSIGLALDKKAKIESEERARRIFQKYVPSNVVQNTLDESEPRLGGSVREVICLFMDIRGFTNLSARLPTAVMVELLNNIFEMLDATVRRSGGVIDKFLGDGAMVTWGAVPGSEVDAKKAMDAAREFLVKLEEWNAGNVAKNLPQIAVGIGMHRGPVIAGNIGSQERMEYTVIGSPVNMASRLEQLCKLYACNLVVSSSLVPFSELGPEWVVQTDVAVRGLDSQVDIATYTSRSKTETDTDSETENGGKAA